MTWIKLGRLLPLAMPLLLACGGSGQPSSPTTPPPPKAIPADEALAVTWGFLALEHGSTLPSQMPTFIQAGDAKILTTTAQSDSCITVITSTKLGITNVLYTFNNCGPRAVTADSLSGSVNIAFSSQTPSFYTVDYRNLVVSKGTQTWIFNGQKTINVSLAAKQANVTATDLSAIFTDSAHPEANRSFLYNANLNADWATADTFKLAGTYSLTYTLAAETHVTGGLIPSATPLVWTTGCCYPVSGSISLAKDSATATAAFALPCGTLAITPAGLASQSQLLPACAQ